MTVFREEAMFALASEKSGAERAAFLKIVCRADLARRQRSRLCLRRTRLGKTTLFLLPAAHRSIWFG